MDQFIEQIKEQGYSDNKEYIESYKAINEQLNQEIIDIDKEILKLEQQIKSLNEQRLKLSRTISNNLENVAILQQPQNNQNELNIEPKEFQKNDDYWNQIKGIALQIKNGSTTEGSSTITGAKRSLTIDPGLEEPTKSDNDEPIKSIKKQPKRAKRSNTKYYTNNPYTLK